MNIESMPLSSALARHRGAVVKKWFERLLQTYPESATSFLGLEQDPFRNPVGHTLHAGLSALLDGLIEHREVASLTPVLDGIVRIRAVQDFTAGQAVAFPFLLKQIVRAEFAADLQRHSDELAALEARIDELALLAFDLFMKCREQVYAIKLNETRRHAFVVERAHRKGQSSLQGKAR